MLWKTFFVLLGSFTIFTISSPVHGQWSVGAHPDRFADDDNVLSSVIEIDGLAVTSVLSCVYDYALMEPGMRFTFFGERRSQRVPFSTEVRSTTTGGITTRSQNRIRPSNRDPASYSFKVESDSINRIIHGYAMAGSPLDYFPVLVELNFIDRRRVLEIPSSDVVLDYVADCFGIEPRETRVDAALPVPAHDAEAEGERVTTSRIVEMFNVTDEGWCCGSVVGVEDWDNLNMRLSPDADSQIIGSLEHNQREIVVFECRGVVDRGQFFDHWEQSSSRVRGSWCLVGENVPLVEQNNFGWVNAYYLRVLSP